MEAGGLDVGHVFARLDGRLDDSNFKRFDTAVDRAKAKSREMAAEQDRLTRSTTHLTREQEKQIKSLRDAGNGWGAVARQTGLNGRALREYQGHLSATTREQDKTTRSTETLTRSQIKQVKSLRDSGVGWQSIAKTVGVSEDALRSWNTTSRTTTREQEKVRKTNRDTEHSFLSLDGAISRVNRGATFLRTTFRILKWPALIAGLGAALGGANALAGGITALTSALAPLVGLLVTAPAALGTFGQALGVGLLSVMGVGKALKALNAEQLKSGGVAEDAAKKQREAAGQIRSSEEQLGSAQRTEKGAQHDLNEARREAIKTLQDMRNAAVDARLGEQGASLALRRSISELWKAEADPKSSMLDIEELELRVKESRQQVKEARLDNKRAQAEENKARRGGVKKDPGVVDAKRSLADADREVAKATRGVAEATRDANEALNETSTSAAKVEEAFAGLSPEAAKFSRFLFSLKPELQGLQATAAKGFLPGAEKGITSAIRNLPVVNRIIGATSRVLGNLSEKAGGLLGSRGFGHDLEIVGKGNARTLGQMGSAGEHLFKGLTKVMVVAQPFLKWTGKYVNMLASWVEHSVEVNRKNGDLARFFGRTRQVVEQLTSTFGNLGGFLHVVGEEAAPLGRQILKVFDEGSEGLDKWAKSTEGRGSIAEYFKDIKGPLWEAGRLVRDIVKDFFELGDGEGMESVQKLLHAIRVELLPIFTDVTKKTTESFGPHLIEMLTNVLGLFGRLSGSTGPLTLYVDSLSAAAKVTNWLIDTIPGTRSILTNLIGLAAVMKTITTLGKWTGITKGLELVFGPELGARMKTRFLKMMKEVMLRGALTANFVYSWAADLGGQMATGITRQTTRLRAAGRKLAISFLSIFVPEVAAGMAAGGKFGEAMSARFPKLEGVFRKGGGMAGKAFLVGLLLTAVYIGIEIGNAINKQWPELGPSMRKFGIRTGETIVNGIIDALNLGISGINKVLDKANVLGKLGVDAPQIGHIGNVNWHSSKERTQERRKQNREKGVVGGAEIEPGVRTIPGQTPKELREALAPVREQREVKRRSEREEARLRSEGKPHGATGPVGGFSLRIGPDVESKQQRKKVTDEHKKMRRDVEDESDKLQKGVFSRFQKMRKGSGEEARKMGRDVTSATNKMRGDNDDATKGMLGDTDTRFSGMRDIVSTRSQAMSEDLGSNVGEMNTTTTEGMQQIQNAVVKALKAFGVKNVDLDITSGAKSGKGQRKAPAKAARGAVFTVPGQGLDDSVYLPGVHAMVAPGENLFAATRHQQPLLDYAVETALGVTGGLDGFFSTYNRPHYLAKGGRAAGVREYASGGGMVDPGWDPGTEQIAKSIMPAVRQWVKRYSADITSGYDPSGHVSPGHLITGTATDVVPKGGWTAAATKRFEDGLRFLVSKGFEVGYGTDGIGLAWPDHGRGNHAHIEWVGNGTAPDAIASLGGMAGLQRIKDLKVKGPAGTIRTLVQAALDRTVAGANHYMGKKTGSLRGPISEMEFGPGALSRDEFLKVAREALRITGHPKLPGGALKLLRLAMQESSLNPDSINLTDSNAAAGIPSQGLMQVIPPTFSAYHEPGTSRNIKDPLANIAASINYQFAKYKGLVTSSPYARGGAMVRRFFGGGILGSGKQPHRNDQWLFDHKKKIYVAPEEELKQPFKDRLFRSGWHFQKERGLEPITDHVETGGYWLPPGQKSIHKTWAEKGGAILQRFASGGKVGLGPGKAVTGVKRPGISSEKKFASPPTGKYSPAALLRIASETGVGLPFALLKDGVPNWRELSAEKYTKLVNEYLKQATEYRITLGEERQSATESFTSNPLLSSVTALSPNTIKEALSYHSPSSPDVDAYGQGYSALSAADAIAEGRRGEYLNTFSESHLAPYERKRAEITYTRDAALRSLKPEREQKEFARAKLKGLRERIASKQAQVKKAVAKKGPAVSGRRAVSPAPARVQQKMAKTVRHQIQKHGRVVARRAKKKGERAEAAYESQTEELLDPVEAEREELERRYQYEQQRREQLAPLLSEIALGVQRTANVGRVQSHLFAPPTFSRGGEVPTSAAQAIASPVTVGSPNVTVPLDVRLSGALEALNPHIQAVVDGKLRDIGRTAGGAKSTVSAPGRRVSYRGK